MIKDKIENAKLYFSLSEGIKEGLEWIISNDLSTKNDGRYNLPNGLYANLQTYNTKDDADFEAHRKYIDIQYMINGSEKFGIANYAEGKTTILYDEGKDIEFMKADGDYLKLSEGEFIILYPQDAHKPSIKSDKPETVKKVVVKVPVK